MFDLIYSIIKYTAPNSIERDKFIDNIDKYFSKEDVYKTKQYIENKFKIINALRVFKIKTKYDVTKLRKNIEILEGVDK